VRREFSDEFKADAVRLYVADPGSSYAKTGAALGVSPHTLAKWVQKAGEGRLTGGASGVGANPALDVASKAVIEEENRRLRVENARLRAERDILKKALPVFLDTTD